MMLELPFLHHLLPIYNIKPTKKRKQKLTKITVFTVFFLNGNYFVFLNVFLIQ